eukprot:5328485-Prymnesium_polylepis.1
MSSMRLIASAEKPGPGALCGSVTGAALIGASTCSSTTGAPHENGWCSFMPSVTNDSCPRI